MNDHAEALFSYSDPHIRDAIWALKYYKRTDFANWFGRIMYEHLIGDYFEENLDGNVHILLIPVPLSSKRQRERGYNQSEEIAKAIVETDKEEIFSLGTNIVFKKHTEPQAHIKNRKERALNIENSFVLKKKEQIADQDVVIIDDVITTGATTNEMRDVLLRSGARSVTTLAVAH